MDNETANSLLPRPPGMESPHKREQQQQPQRDEVMEVPIPPMMRGVFSAEPKFIHSLVENIKEAVKGLRVEVKPDSIVITCPLKEKIRRVEAMSDMITEQMSQWYALQRQVSGTRAQYAIFTEEFSVSQNRMGQAIGPRGTNVSAARKIDGVQTINNSDKFLKTTGCVLFQVKARTAEAARDAREMLESNSITVKVPRELVGRVIGSQGVNIQNIVDRSGVARVSVDTESPAGEGDSECVHFIFHGIGMPLLDAKAMISLVINHAKWIDQVRKDYLGSPIEERRSWGGSGQQQGTLGGRR